MPLLSDPSIWHSMPGVVAAYQPVGAPSASRARWNMARGGDTRYAAAEGVLPAFNPANGWGFDGSSQYLKTILHPSEALTLLIQFTGAVNGDSYTGAYDFKMFPNSNGNCYFERSSSVVADAFSDGNIGMSGSQGYRNGLPYGSAVSGTAYDGYHILIGAQGEDPMPDGPVKYCQWTIQAWVALSRILTDAEMRLAAQQMAYCHVNPAWSVWSPARRWFFVPPPPPPAAATPVLSTIYINSADIGDTSLFDDVEGAVISTSYARTGTYSFKLAGGDSLQANLTSSATKYTKFGLLVTDAPSDNHLLVAWQETGTEHVSLYLTKDLQLQMLQSERIIQTSPTTLETERWYCVESKIVVHDTIGRFQVRIDGVDDMTAIGINTDDGVGGTINEIRFESPVDDTYIDDIVVREDQWCGAGGVYVVVPAAAGQADEWSGSYADVNELPPSFADYISVTPGDNKATFRHQGLTIDYAQMPIVGVFAKARLDAAADVLAYAAAFSNEEFATGGAQDLDETGVYARLLMTTNPDGSAVWTAAAVGAMEIGIKA